MKKITNQSKRVKVEIEKLLIVSRYQYKLRHYLDGKIFELRADKLARSCR